MVALDEIRITPIQCFSFKAMYYKKCSTTKARSVFGIVWAMVRAPEFIAMTVTVTAIKLNILVVVDPTNGVTTVFNKQ